MIGLSVALIPVFDQIKYYYVLRIMISIGSTFGLNVPLLPDYVKYEFIGRAMAII